MSMAPLVHIICGLAFWGLGLAAVRDLRKRSELLLRRQLPWLAAFAILEGTLQWLALLPLSTEAVAPLAVLQWIRTVLLPVSSLLLLRFGIGLLSRSGPLPGWLLVFPSIVLVPAALLVAYTLVLLLTEPSAGFMSLVWARLLLLVPGGIITAWGFLRQSNQSPTISESPRLRKLARWAAVAFLAYTFAFGVLRPLDPELMLTGPRVMEMVAALLPIINLLHVLVSVYLAFVVVRLLGVFDLEQRVRLKAAETKARASEQRLSTVFQNAPLGMHLLDEQLRLTRVNEAAEHILGYSATDLQQRRFVDLITPTEQDAALRGIEDVRDGRLGAFQSVTHFVAKDGSLIDGRLSVTAARDEAGALDYLLAMIEDVTEQTRVERELQAERGRVQEERIQAMSEARQTTAEWVTSLVGTSRRIAHLQAADEILVHLLGEARRLLGADLATLGLFNSAGDLMAHCVASEQLTGMLEPPTPVPNEALAAILRAGRRGKFPGDDETGQIDWSCPVADRPVQSAAVVPLQVDGTVVGGIWICYYDQQRLAHGQVQGLSYLANQAVVALQQASMISQLQSAATVEERARIAREMHDGLSQVLGYLSLQVQTIQSLVREGEQDRALGELERTRNNIKAAHADVRDNILSLRTTLAGNGGLVQALAEYLEGFGQHTGLEVQFTDETHGDPRLSPMAEVQVIRVLQEALANVRKHAHANHVELRLWNEEHQLCAAVRDDGRGFDPDAADDGTFGLQTMRERARDVGGLLTIDARPGHGAQVRICVPQQGTGGKHGPATAVARPHH